VSRNGTRALGVVTVLGLAMLGIIFMGVSVGELAKRGLEFVLAALAGGGIFFYLMLRGPVGKAIAGLLEGDTQHDEELIMRVEDLEARLGELSLEQQRVAELEERLDFAERLLAAREPGMIEGKSS
jgi:hypothetical protein